MSERADLRTQSSGWISRQTAAINAGTAPERRKATEAEKRAYRIGMRDANRVTRMRQFACWLFGIALGIPGGVLLAQLLVK